jgi:membrane protease subunit (stomatin/prohibitin family)
MATIPFTNNYNDLSFCPECGVAISPKRQCANCGTEADGTPKFCPECGKPYGT